MTESGQMDAERGATQAGLLTRVQRERALFEAIRDGAGETLPARALQEALERAGLAADDPRLRECRRALHELRRVAARGAALDCADDDGRTPLPLAAAEGRLRVVEFLADQGVPLEPRDRFSAGRGRTPAAC